MPLPTVSRKVAEIESHLNAKLLVRGGACAFAADHEHGRSRDRRDPRRVGLTCTLSHQIAESVSAGRLVVVLRKFEPAPLPVSLLYVHESRITAKLRVFVDFAAPRLRARLTSAAI